MPIIQIDRRARESLHRQIYNSYRTAIVDGALRPGERIPSTRILASELGLSRIPVLNAYAQLLAEGYLEARVGAGTVISSTLPDQVTPQRSGRRIEVRRGPRPMPVNGTPLPSIKAALPWLNRRWGAFNPGQPALDHFPYKVWSRLIADRSRNLRMASMHYDDPMGSKHLRKVIAAYLRTARGVRCEADNIMIVSGFAAGARDLHPGIARSREPCLDGRSGISIRTKRFSLEWLQGCSRACRRRRNGRSQRSEALP